MLAGLCLLTLLACVPLRPAAEDKVIAVLDQLPAGLPHGRARAATLLVLAPDSQAIYDTTRIAYREAPHSVAYFSRHEWGATPSQMLHSLLLRMLDQEHYFSAVLIPPYAGQYRYVLQIRIQELIQDFTSDVPTLRLALHVQLNDGMSNRALASREIALQETMRERTPLAGVEAANRAVEKALRQLAAFLLEAAH
jgi:cholesterol transport system auxiliary component